MVDRCCSQMSEEGPSEILVDGWSIVSQANQCVRDNRAANSSSDWTNIEDDEQGNFCLLVGNVHFFWTSDDEGKGRYLS